MLRRDPIIGPSIPGILETEEKEIIRQEDVARAHSDEYSRGLFSDRAEELLLQAYELIDQEGKYRRYDPRSAHQPLREIVPVQLRRVGGTLQSLRSVLPGPTVNSDRNYDPYCFFFGGGFHHAHYDFGHGFCPVNDIVIALRRLQAEGRIRGAWVIDGDAHKGDGTAALTRDDESISTLSIHMADGWPLDIPPFDARGKPHPSHTPSTVDIPIGEEEQRDYVPKLARGLEELERRHPSPDLAVVVFGADPYVLDGLESARKLQLSREQLLQRDQLIFRFLKHRAVPAAYLMAGGYGPYAWEINYQFLRWVMTEGGDGA